MIELFGMSSPNVLKVMLALEELELPYLVRRIDIWAQEQFTDEFRALNPNSKVPAIVDRSDPDADAVTVFESGAILMYLAERHDRLLPRGLRERTTVVQWLMLQMSSIGPMFGQSNHFRLSAPPGNDYAVARYITEVKRLYEVLETRLLRSDWLGGAEYSIADVATWPWAALYAKPNGVALDGLPGVMRWVEAIKARPATQRAMDTWKELMEHGTQRRASAEPENLDRLFGRGRFSRV